MYILRLASNEIFSPSNKIHREVGRAKDLSAPRGTKGWSPKASHNIFLSVPFLPAFISLLSKYFQMHAEIDLTRSHDKSLPNLT